MDGAYDSGAASGVGRATHLRLLRERAGLRPKGLADEAGVSVRLINYLEKDDAYQTSLRTIEALAAVYERRGLMSAQDFASLFVRPVVGEQRDFGHLSGDETRVEIGRTLVRAIPPEDWETHLARVRLAERFLSSSRREALWPASRVVESLLQLGRYPSAEAEIDRILTTYPRDLDIELTANLLFQRGRLLSARGALAGAEAAYRAAVSLQDETRHEWSYFFPHPLHFLARYLGEVGEWDEAENLYAAAFARQMQREAYHQAVWDVLWRVVMRLRRASESGAHYDPRAEFAQAEQLSARTYGYHHIQLERAWVQLREGGNPDPREAMETWRASGYALGVARYFNLRMGSLSQMEKVVEALEAGVAALLAAPAARTENARIWAKLLELRSALQSATARADLEHVLEHAHARRGPFGDIESIARDHLDQSAEQIVELLGRRTSPVKLVTSP